MTTIAVVRRLVDEVWNAGRVELLPELFAETFDHDGRPDTVASLADWQAEHDRTWSDTHYVVDTRPPAGRSSGAARTSSRWSMAGSPR